LNSDSGDDPGNKGFDEEAGDTGEDKSSADESDGDAESSSRPYLSLMKSLTESTPRNPKRRKLDHPDSQDRADEVGLDEDARDPDRLDEAEDSEEDAGEDVADDLFNHDDDLDASDPFELHFANADDGDLQEKLKAVQASEWQLDRISAAPWRVFVNKPKTQKSTETVLPKPVPKPADLKLKARLREVMDSAVDEFDDLEGFLAPILFNYHDTLFCSRSVENAGSLRRLACLHALNHIFK
jgi:U3 small nucleolar RNA-associated protein 25